MNTNQAEGQKNTSNTYRVLMSRAREAMVIGVPPGDESDPARPVEWMDAAADSLRESGV